jgi:hypothetical protein
VQVLSSFSVLLKVILVCVLLGFVLGIFTAGASGIGDTADPGPATSEPAH